MEPIHPVGREVDTPDQRRGSREREDRRGAHDAPLARRAHGDEAVPEAVPLGPAELLSEAELLREAEVLFRANEIERLRGSDPADANEKATSDPARKDAEPTEEQAQAEQTRLANLVRDIEQTRVGELAYQTEQARLAAEAAGVPPANTVSVLL